MSESERPSEVSCNENLEDYKKWLQSWAAFQRSRRIQKNGGAKGVRIHGLWIDEWTAVDSPEDPAA